MRWAKVDGLDTFDFADEAYSAMFQEALE